MERSQASGPEPRDPPHTTSLATFIRERADEILREWEAAVRGLPIAQDLDRLALLDHIPHLLEQIADMADDVAAGGAPVLPKELAERHALERLEEGFDLAQVVVEFSILRDCIVRLWERDRRPSEHLADLRVLHKAIDRAISESVDRYTQARDRSLQSIDRISAAALEARSLDEFLHRLLRVLLDTTAAVDTVTILLREGDRLVARASVGLEAEVETGWSLRIGEGFAGLIAQTLRPHATKSACSDPLVLSPIMRAKGVKALYGVPLVEGGQVLGVAKMGSLTANDFSQQDKRLLAAMAHRATAGIVQHLLREAAERRAGQQEALAAFGQRTLRIEGTHALLDEAVHVVARVLGVELAGALELRDDGTFAVAAVYGGDASIGRAVPVPANDASQAGLTVTTGRPVVVEDIEQERRFDSPHPFAAHRIRSAMSVPIHVPGGPQTTYGVLGAYALKRRAFSAEDVHFLEGIANVVGTAIALRRAEAGLREREDRFRTLADNIPQLAWMADGKGWIFWYNRRWYDYTGTTLEEMQGWGWKSVHHPDHLERVVEKVSRHFETGEVWEDTFPLRGKDGRFRWFLSRAIPIRDDAGRVARWFGTNTDVTEQRLLADAATALASSLNHRVVVQQVAQLLVPVVADWCVIDLVDELGALQRVGVAHSDTAAGGKAAELGRRHPPDWNGDNGVMRVIRSGKPESAAHVPDEALVKAARDPEHLAELRALGLKSYAAVPIVARGRVLGCILVVSIDSGRTYEPRDVGYLEELARHVANAVDNARLYEQAQQAVRMREEVLAVVSHDLRNPLAAIQMAAANMLRRPAGDARLKQQIETVHRSSTRMDHLIGDLLDMASIQAGRLSVERKPEEAAALVAEAVEVHEPAAKEKGVAILRECTLETEHVLCDRDRVFQVFGNLLGNAVKFCSPGDVITVRSEVVAGAARFTISDTGPGIQESALAHVFEPYWSAEEHRKKGTGLGLYICKGIVEAHGGRLWVESKLGHGANFTFTLPLAP